MNLNETFKAVRAASRKLANLNKTIMNLNETFKAVRTASRKLAMLDAQTINTVLCAVADKIEEKTDVLLEANQEDLQRMETSNPKYDRLKLTPERLEGIAADMRQVASLPSPLGIVREAYTVPSGLRLPQRTSFTEGERAVWGDRSNL